MILDEIDAFVGIIVAFQKRAPYYRALWDSLHWGIKLSVSFFVAISFSLEALFLRVVVDS